MLYESFIHPLTILSGLPSAGFGALLTLLIFQPGSEHLRVRRHHHARRAREEERHHDDRLRHRGTARPAASAPADAIHEACLVRFRPIMMTTMAALMGTLPIALGLGRGRRSAPPARPRRRRRPAGLADADALRHARVLRLPGAAAGAIRKAACRRARTRPGPTGTRIGEVADPPLPNRGSRPRRGRRDGSANARINWRWAQSWTTTVRSDGLTVNLVSS